MRRYVIIQAGAPVNGHHIYDVHGKCWLFNNRPSGETWCKNIEYAHVFPMFADAQATIAELENRLMESVERAAKTPRVTTPEIIGWGLVAFCIVAIVILFIK